MDRPTLTVGDIVRRYGDASRHADHGLSTAQRRVLTAIATCRTAALGGHVEQCHQCGHTRVRYNSCLMESARFWGARVSSRFQTLDLWPIRPTMHSP